MTAFSDAYARLNSSQKLAVDTIEGPLLVIAGPGTGKTQLLSARVANILSKTDTPAQNILCLTFTESGAANMRERLTRFIGQSAYEVNISTYHAFGGDLIGTYPEYFGDARLQKPVDDLGRRQILLDIAEAMDYRNPLKQTRHHIGDLLSTVSEVKRALLDSPSLRKIAKDNLLFITQGSRGLQEIFHGIAKMPGTHATSRPYFEQVLEMAVGMVPRIPTKGIYKSLAEVCVIDLQQALTEADSSAKSTPLTKWKNNWLAKNTDNQFVFAGQLENNRIEALADVLDRYQSVLAEQGMYDFDDMILRSIQALEKHADFRYTLQERYLYILLDEFQDTNAAQLRLVQLMTDSPVNEGRPNILAVGDDDQAIYAFQGAQYSNMIEFNDMFRDSQIINLTENYRSHADILKTARNVAAQVASRLDNHFSGAEKSLVAANPRIVDAAIERREFQSDIAERAWIAAKIKQLVDAGVPAGEIAVLSPKHKPLEQLVPFLNDLNIPVRYEKRENILDAPIVRQLITMSRLLVALAGNHHAIANSLWPEVLSYHFWKIPTATIWQLSWQVSDDRSPDKTVSWSKAILQSEDNQCQAAGKVLLATAQALSSESCEIIIDYMIGSQGIEVHEDSLLFSPLRQYYTSPEVQKTQPELFYQTLSHLKILRTKIQDFQESEDHTLMLPDLIRFVSMYEAAGQPLINTSPYSQQSEAVQLSTVFKAKGLEYEHVFIPHCLDDVWGSSSRGNSNKLTLPPNLEPIRHAGATDDERLRILFVAITRAKRGLYLSSALRDYRGKVSKRLKYFDEEEQDDGSFRTLILPTGSSHAISEDTVAPLPVLMELDWQTRHKGGLDNASLQGLLAGRTDDFRISPTHLVKFVDLEYSGPQQFFFDTILRFPNTPSPESQFGTAIHETLEWFQHQVSENGYAPSVEAAIERFIIRIRSRRMTEQRTLLEIERGRHVLTAYLNERSHIFGINDIAEKNFRSDRVKIGDVQMSGKIDRLEIDNKNKIITVVDYKTGTSYPSWKKDLKMHKFQLQLYAYKILIESSKTFRDFVVPTGRLEFIEPDAEGRINSLNFNFNDDETDRVSKLLEAVWKHTKDLDFPEATEYPVTLAGVIQFEQDLLDERI